jgi:hypothetical protein
MNEAPPAERWRKSSYSNAGNECVEVGATEGGCAVRDSKNPGSLYLTFGITAWAAFIGNIKHGR